MRLFPWEVSVDYYIRPPEMVNLLNGHLMITITYRQCIYIWIYIYAYIYIYIYIYSFIHGVDITTIQHVACIYTGSWLWNQCHAGGMWNIASRAGIKPTSLAVQSSRPPIIQHRLPDVSTPYPYPLICVSHCLRGLCRLLPVYLIIFWGSLGPKVGQICWSSGFLDIGYIWYLKYKTNWKVNNETVFNRYKLIHL